MSHSLQLWLAVTNLWHLNVVLTDVKHNAIIFSRIYEIMPLKQMDIRAASRYFPYLSKRYIRVVHEIANITILLLLNFAVGFPDGITAHETG